MDYIIRKIKKEDSKDVTHVVTVAWNEAYKGMVPDEVLQELYTNEEERVKRLEESFEGHEMTSLVLEVDGKVVGFSHYATANQNNFPGCGEIRALYILSKYHGYGFGRKLVEESIKELKKMGFNKMIICCLRDNINANKFYEHIGGKYIKDGVYERLNLPEKIYFYDNLLEKSNNMKEMIKLVHYTDEDYEFVYEVKKNAYKKYVEECWGSWIEEDQRTYFEKFITTVKDNVYIIMDGNKKIGFYNGEVLENENYEVGNICIIPEYQGKGIGTKILKDKLEENKGRDIEIQYFKQNPVGALYERLGFIPNGETEFHYQMIKPKQEILRK